MRTWWLFPALLLIFVLWGVLDSPPPDCGHGETLARYLVRQLENGRLFGATLVGSISFPLNGMVVSVEDEVIDPADGGRVGEIPRKSLPSGVPMALLRRPPSNFAADFSRISFEVLCCLPGREHRETVFMKVQKRALADGWILAAIIQVDTWDDGPSIHTFRQIFPEEGKTRSQIQPGFSLSP